MGFQDEVGALVSGGVSSGTSASAEKLARLVPPEVPPPDLSQPAVERTAEDGRVRLLMRRLALEHESPNARGTTPHVGAVAERVWRGVAEMDRRQAAAYLKRPPRGRPKAVGWENAPEDLPRALAEQLARIVPWRDRVRLAEMLEADELPEPGGSAAVLAALLRPPPAGSAAPSSAERLIDRANERAEAAGGEAAEADRAAPGAAEGGDSDWIAPGSVYR